MPDAAATQGQERDEPQIQYTSEPDVIRSETSLIDEDLNVPHMWARTRRGNRKQSAVKHLVQWEVIHRNPNLDVGSILIVDFIELAPYLRMPTVSAT